jgi:rhodanese-related sulfurtransferase
MTLRRRWILVALLAVLPPSVPAFQGDESTVPRITVDEVKTGLAAGTVLLVDVRDAVSFERGHLPGAVLVPLSEVAAKAAELKTRKKTLVTYCG